MKIRTRETLTFEVEHRPSQDTPFVANCSACALSISGRSYEELLENAELAVLKLAGDSYPQMVFKTFLQVPVMLPEEV